MLRAQGTIIEQKPKKLFKVNVMEVEDYNEFKGEAIKEEREYQQVNTADDPQPDIGEEINRYKEICKGVFADPRANRKLNIPGFTGNNSTKK